MATTKKYVDLDGLGKYGELLKNYIDNHAAVAIDVIFSYDPVNNTLSITGSSSEVTFDEETKTLNISL